ncbi:MAG: Na+/H+ antiporter subunit E [Rhizobiales bacterium 63-7]|nr:MAG: Na+/H+ antiporter subunit E [Rhizobiales bacterium 63-7]
MSIDLPYPLLTVALTVMWMSLNSFSFGHLVLGLAIAWVASAAMAALRPEKPRIRRPLALIRLLASVIFRDIVLSNIAVARIILGVPRHARRPGFMTIPLEMTSQTGLALLAVLLTGTPGTSWLEYNSNEGTLLIHVLDLDDEEALRDLIKNRYERTLMEVFE